MSSQDKAQTSAKADPRPKLLAGMAIALVVLTLVVAILFRGGLGTGARTSSSKQPPEIDRSKLSSDVKELLDIWYETLEKFPDEASSWGSLGEALYANGFRDEGAECFKVARELAAGSDERYPYFLGRCLELTDPDRAIELYQEAIEIADHPGVIRLRLAELYFDNGRYDECRELILLIHETIGKITRSLVLEARLDLQEGDVESAQSSAELALEMDSERPQVHQLLTQIYFRLNQPELAETSRQLAQADPRPWEDYYFDDVMLLQRGIRQRVASLDRAEVPVAQRLEVLREAVETEPHIPAWHGRLANVLMNSNQVEEAADVIKKGIELHPQAAELLYVKGLVEFRRQNWEAASAAFSSTIEAKADYVEAYVFRGLVLRMLGEPSSAISDFEQAIALQPQNQSALYNLALTLQLSGSLSAALEKYEELIALGPESEEPYVQAAELLLRANEVQKARMYLTEALRRNSENETAKQLIAELME